LKYISVLSNKNKDGDHGETFVVMKGTNSPEVHLMFTNSPWIRNLESLS
jgi:hypothetical protein